MAKRVSIKDKNIAKTNDIDTLFPTSKPQTSDQNGTKKKISILRKIEDIISYYKILKAVNKFRYTCLKRFIEWLK